VVVIVAVHVLRGFSKFDGCGGQDVLMVTCDRWRWRAVGRE